MDSKNPTKATFFTGDVVRPKGKIFAEGSMVQESYFDMKDGWKIKTSKYGEGLAKDFRFKSKSR